MRKLMLLLILLTTPIIIIDGSDGPTTCITFPTGEVVCN
jgi:hypothetical protein